FSVYIFNVKTVRQLIKDIRKASSCKIIVGGPEVDLDLDANHIVFGEGETALYNLLTSSGEKVIYGKNITNLDDIPSPYTVKRLSESKNKLIYYESSRGCPFSCSYCMAGLTKGVRYFSLERVQNDLKRIVDSGAKIIKFTDRTFNANTERTNAILNMIANNFADKDVCFHFEVGGDLFNKSTLDILKTLPVGLVQMEAGVQTLNEKSLQAICRKFNKERFLQNITKILSYNNIHMHLDLIAGLPYETMESFIYSFNGVMNIKPHKVQLGFLKMLKHTPIRESYNAVFESDAPYEIVSTPYMTENELATLKDIDWITDKLYNTGKFSYTLELLLNNCNNYYQLFYNLAEHFKELGIKKGAQEHLLYQGILSYSKNDKRIKESLRFDYLLTNKSSSVPKVLRNKYTAEFKRFLSSRKTNNLVCYESFSYLTTENKDGNFIVEFDYIYKNKVSGKFSYKIIES
ncbi:MAG: DUF4080 domain-containing protein, partial [Clostridiales bacterium]|nr:DUF4080 domain-containing protein [Clostridiales bacterium]